jgi:hypothetical protein
MFPGKRYPQVTAQESQVDIGWHNTYLNLVFCNILEAGSASIIMIKGEWILFTSFLDQRS